MTSHLMATKLSLYNILIIIMPSYEIKKKQNFYLHLVPGLRYRESRGLLLLHAVVLGLLLLLNHVHRGRGLALHHDQRRDQHLGRGRLLARAALHAQKPALGEEVPRHPTVVVGAL